MAPPLKELTPHVSLRHFFGAELQHWRQRAGLSPAGKVRECLYGLRELLGNAEGYLVLCKGLVPGTIHLALQPARTPLVAADAGVTGRQALEPP